MANQTGESKRPVQTLICPVCETCHGLPLCPAPTPSEENGASFQALQFKDAPNHYEPRRAKMDFPNGYTASVVIGPYTYGGRDGKYELAVMHGGKLVYDTPITEDVIGHLEPEEVTELLKRIAALPVREVQS